MRASQRNMVCPLLLVPLVLLVNVRSEMALPPAPKAVVPASAANAEGFAPHGWRIQRRATGDLNGDGRPDLVLVLQSTDPKLVMRNDYGGEPLNTNPRSLVVAFARPEGGYNRVAQNSSLIPRWTEQNHDDNFGAEGKLSIARGAFTVTEHYFASMGGWDTGTRAYTFRWQNNRFELIGADSNNLTRNTGGTVQSSVNYMTHRVVVTTHGDTFVKSRSFTLQQGPLKTLDDIGNGMEFSIPGSE